VKDTAMLKAKLEDMFPGFEKIKYMLAVNRKIIRENMSLSGSETIALMPPFSGG
jgi:molybdopterin synthase sulfur carrier subunit